MTPKLQKRVWMFVALCMAIAPATFAQRSGYSGYSGYGGSSRGGFGGSSSSYGSRGGSSSSSSSGARDYPNSTMIGDAVITADPETRRLIVITDEATHENISQVISNLDRPKPQVLIKVVFAEVTYNNSLDVGVEGSYHKNTAGNILSGLTTNFTVLTNGTIVPRSITPNSVPNPNNIVNAGSTFGLASQLATGSSSALGFAQYATSDYTVTLKALAQNGKVEILSRPTILARNNQKASIVVGQEVPLITGTSYDTFGGLHNAFQYQNVGIILDVTPFITPDGLVEMILKPQISSVNHDPSQSVAVSSGGTNNTGSVYAPVIDVRAADTVVVTPDGNTVVIGGLMQNLRSKTVDKVPLLGDIPGLGFLFRHNVESNTKTELLIFLTPYVVQTPHQLAMMSTSETSRTRLAPQAFSEQELNQFLDNVQLKKREEAKGKNHKKTSNSTLNSGSPKDRD